MTCIVGIADAGKVYIGGDSCGSDGWGVRADSYSYKVFERTVGHGENIETSEQMILGITASFRVIDILTYIFEPPAIHPTADVDRYLRTTFVDALYKCLNKHHAVKDNDDVAEITENSDIIVGIRGKLYHIQADLSVLNTPVYGTAAGSGYQVALGALYSMYLFESIPAKERIEKALEAAGKIVGSVSAPYYIKEI